MSRDPAMIPRDGTAAARMGISAARNPYEPDSAAHYRWHADYQGQMAHQSKDRKVAGQHRKLADRYRLMFENADMFEIAEDGK